MLVEVWSDVVCPWCYIGKRRFERALTLLADDGLATAIEVVYRPYQLDPTAPPGITVPVAEAYARKFGGPARAAEVIRHITTVAAGEGLEFRLDRARRANTRDAHRLLAFAAAAADRPPGTQAALKEQLLAAYFVDGADIGDHDELTNRAVVAGLDAEAVRRVLASDEHLAELAEDLAFAAAAGITAVPTYVIDGRWSIPGAQDAEVFVEVLRRLAAANHVG